jgi:hypothetical protein
VLNNIGFPRAPETERPFDRPWYESDNTKGAAPEGEEDSNDLTEDDRSEEEVEDEIEDEDEEDEDGMDDEDDDVGDRYDPSLARDNAPAADQLLELLFQLSVTFSTEQFLDGEPSSSILVFFSGILGFSSDTKNFLPTKNYTPYLSGLIYVQRLLFLEYALPRRAYPYIGILQCPRLRQYERMDAIRQQYMVTGSQSPLEEF